mgnify:CR=1 FL=1
MAKRWKIKSAIASLRLRTLPLSLAGTVLGVLLAASDYYVDWMTALFIFLTTVSLQILSNLSNELGDVLKGTDTKERQGPEYGLSSGVLSIDDMKFLIGIFIGLSILSGLLMIYFSFGSLFSIESLCLILLGASAILGAMKYTLGRNPYGYRGLGDIYVFIFFGLVAVLGSYFVAAHDIHTWTLVLPAASIGCFSVAVLNVNNIRDMRTDSVNRTTIAIKLGLKGARIYQTVLIVAGWVFMLLFCCLRFFDIRHFLFVLTLPLYVKHLHGIWTKCDRDLDPMLPLLVISTFAFSLLTGLGFLVFLINT